MCTLSPPRSRINSSELLIPLPVSSPADAATTSAASNSPKLLLLLQPAPSLTLPPPIHCCYSLQLIIAAPLLAAPPAAPPAAHRCFIAASLPAPPAAHCACCFHLRAAPLNPSQAAAPLYQSLLLLPSCSTASSPAAAPKLQRHCINL